jgi:ribonuclease HI
VTSGNPGPSGAGAVLLGPGGRPLAEAAQWLGHATNNEAEYRALLAGLRLAARVPGVRRLLVEGDSTLVTRQMAGQWKVEAPGLVPLWTAAREAARAFDACEYRYIPREENAAVRPCAGPLRLSQSL